MQFRPGYRRLEVQGRSAAIFDRVSLVGIRSLSVCPESGSIAEEPRDFLSVDLKNDLIPFDLYL